MSSLEDTKWMQQALDLAREGAGLASPNPTVGCVLVKNGHVLGRGFHVYDHRDHAEIVALKEAGGEAEGCTAYVTLEPCSHTGRTGPCADALIRAKVARVVAATRDPNPEVAGRGLARLQSAGIEVTLGIMQAEARRLNDAFAHWITTAKPFVTLKAALSVDGYLAPDPRSRTRREPFWLTGALARNRVQQMRHGADAVITGIGTVLADDPQLTDRTGLPRRRPLLRVILDSQLRTPPASKLLATTNNDLLLLCDDSASPFAEEALVLRGAEVRRLPGTNGRLDLGAVLDHLATRAVCSVLGEGGSRLNAALLQADLVDEVVLFYSEAELGAGALPFAEGGPSPFHLEQRLTRLEKATLGSDSMVTGYLRDPWQMPLA